MDNSKKLEFEVKAKLYQAELSVLREIIQEHAVAEEGTDAQDLNWVEALVLIETWLTKELDGKDGGKTTLLSLSHTLTPATLEEVTVEAVKSASPVNVSEHAHNVTDKKETSTKLSVFRKDFKVSGQINDAKTGISFVSLVRQIDNAQKKGFSDVEIIDGVVKALSHGSQLRTYLEGRDDLDLTSVRKILRCHFQEKTATELYQELGSATQLPKEEPPDFLLRLLSLKQKIQFVSKESGNDMKYDDQLINNMFRRTFYTGLHDDVIRREIQSTIENVEADDEELIQHLSSVVSRERERVMKLGKNKVSVRQVSQNEEIISENKVTQKPKEGLVVTEIRQLKAEVAALRNLVLPGTKDDVTAVNGNLRNQNRRSVGCSACNKAGIGKACRHCWFCGSEEHFSKGCLKKRQSLQQGNVIGQLPGGRKAPKPQN